MNHIPEDLLIAVVLDEAEPPTRAEVNLHLAGCERCRQDAEEVRRVLRAAAIDQVPARGDDYGAHVWARLEPRLFPAHKHPRWADRRRWLAAAAVVLLAVSAFVVGRWSGAPVEPTRDSAVREVSTHPRSVRERVVLAAIGDHVERAERALVELAHTTDAGTVDITAEQVWARQLLDANRLYRQSLQDASSPALADLLGELEPILLELVNSPSRLSEPDVRALQARIEERSLVFKLRVTGAQMRARQRTLFHNGEPTS
jgi:HAMP domain-containing protein